MSLAGFPLDIEGNIDEASADGSLRTIRGRRGRRPTALGRSAIDAARPPRRRRLLSRSSVDEGMALRERPGRRPAAGVGARARSFSRQRDGAPPRLSPAAALSPSAGGPVVPSPMTAPRATPHRDGARSAATASVARGARFDRTTSSSAPTGRSRTSDDRRAMIGREAVGDRLARREITRPSVMRRGPVGIHRRATTRPGVPQRQRLGMSRSPRTADHRPGRAPPSTRDEPRSPVRRAWLRRDTACRGPGLVGMERRRRAMS